MKIGNVILVAIVIVSLFMVAKNLKTPSGLGVADGKLAPLPKRPNAVSSQTDLSDKYVSPFPFKKNLEMSKSKMLEVLGQYGNISVISNNGNYIHAISTTPRMRFKDDLEFYFDKQAALIHFRSASRVGYSDMGLNKERYNKLFKRYELE